MSFKEELKKAFEGQNPPYLFVGSGFSKRYLASPSWGELLEKIRATLGDSYPQEKYIDPKVTPPDLPGYAEKMADDIKNLWWNSDRYSYIYGDNENRKIAAGDYGPLKQVACHVISQDLSFPDILNGDFPETALRYETQKVLSDELELFQKINSPCLITTNYDSLIEKLLEYDVFVGQDDLILSHTQGVGEIYKIHGDINVPNSIVLTKSDYDRFKAHDKYLHAKILTIFAENPIVFLGYSLSDKNIQEIIRGIVDCIGGNQEKYNSFSSRIYIVDRPRGDSCPRIEPCEISLDGIIFKARKVYLNNYLDLFDVLANNVKLQVPAKTLKFFVENLYDTFSDPQKLSNILLRSIDEIVEEVNKGNGEKLIAGLTFSAPQGTGFGSGFQRMGANTVRDAFISGQDSNWNVYEYIRYFSTSNSGKWLPIHRYLNNISLKDFKSNISTEEASMLSAEVKKVTVDKIKSAQISVPAPLDGEYQSINQVVNLGTHKYKDKSGKEKGVTVGHMGSIILKMNESKISEADLFKFISGNKDKLKKYKLVYPKIICLYDYIKYADNPVSKHVLKL